MVGFRIVSSGSFFNFFFSLSRVRILPALLGGLPFLYNFIRRFIIAKAHIIFMNLIKGLPLVLPSTVPL